MKTLQLLIGLIIFSFALQAQTVATRLNAAIKKLEADSQMKNAIIGLYVVNTKDGSVVYNKNGNVGLAAASSQKVITSITALDLLGAAYRFKTEIGHDGKIENGVLNGNLFVTGYGDPTLGSWRYAANKEEIVMDRWAAELKRANINSINGDVLLDASRFSFDPIPGGWIWDDIGNYYGAGTWGLNWHENQFDVLLKPGEKEEDDVQVLETKPVLHGVVLFNLLKTGKKGSSPANNPGANAYIYLAPYNGFGYLKGTLPPVQKTVEISGSFPNPVRQLEDELKGMLYQNKITVQGLFINSLALTISRQPLPQPASIIYTHYSPALDSINYWFLKKSINLYGETLVKTIALEQEGIGGADEGIKIINNYWKEKGIEPGSMKMIDGSGLSPQNRITCKALTQVMQYATSRSWFTSFYNALPEYNGMKMKSGTIGGAKSFTGYSTSKAGNKYTFAIIINNYHGPSSEAVSKMYKVLDVLK